MRLIGVCGGRDYGDAPAVQDALKSMLMPGDVIVQGGAKGADELARRCAFGMGHDVITVHANWDKLGKSAGPRRNAIMANLPLALLIAFPGGVGTASMVNLAIARGIQVVDVGVRP